MRVLLLTLSLPPFLSGLLSPSLSRPSSISLSRPLPRPARIGVQDGRFKCQRAESPTGARPPRHAQSDQEEEEPDEEEEEAEMEEAELEDEQDWSGSWRRKRSGARPLVCPPVECPAEEQIRPSNHCCTYCRGTDFCALARCHPNATCASLGPPALANLSSPTTFETLFACACKPGFVGDGLQACSDVDECASSPPPCDPLSSDCLNRLGDFECACKKGFKRAPGSDAKAPCQDVDECADGKLNLCHPQAHCVNLVGSYRCQCKRGYLGNGLECHKWFSSAPEVAAYLHIHGSSPGAASNEPLVPAPTDYDNDPAEASSNLAFSSSQQVSLSNWQLRLQLQLELGTGWPSRRFICRTDGDIEIIKPMI